jgi:hypothetical protein
MNRQHEIYLQQFCDELYACGYRGDMTPEMVNLLTMHANNGKSPIQAAQMIYLSLKKNMDKN